MDLQMFAEEDFEEQEDVELENENVEIDDTEEVEVEEEVEAPPKRRSDHVPLDKYMSEKKRRQELERKIAAQDEERDEAKLLEELVNRGYPEREARILASERVQERVERESLKSIKLDLEIQKLAGSDPFYSDADAFATEIKDKLRELPKITVEEAYTLVRGKSRLREMQTKTEQLNKAKRAKVETKKVDTASSSAPKNQYKLDDTDKKALAELKKAQPDANWTSEKFYKLMKE